MFKWKCSELLKENYVAVILNTPISHPGLVLSILENAKFRIFVDGGANYLYRVLSSVHHDPIAGHMPDIICGDLDSVSDEVLQHYKTRGTKIVCTPDQNKTDFFKCLEIIANHTKYSTVIAYTENVGRLDQIMANINTLFLVYMHPILRRLKIFLLAEKNLSWLLSPGPHIIQIPQILWNEKSYCGLIPIGNSCEQVTTDGLKWNLDNQRLSFGGLVSSSNTYDIQKKVPEVRITTDRYLLWTMSSHPSIFTLES